MKTVKVKRMALSQVALSLEGISYENILHVAMDLTQVLDGEEVQVALRAVAERGKDAEQVPVLQ